MNEQHVDLKTLFQQPASLTGSQALARNILHRVENQQRRRSLYLWTAGLAGAALAAGALTTVVGWPLIASAASAAMASLDGLFGHELSLRNPPVLLAQYGVWMFAALGLIATGVAAARSMHSR